MMNSRLSLLTLACATLLVGGCSTVGGWFDTDEETPLPGERISVLELEESLEPSQESLESFGLVMPAPWRNEFWPQAGGYPNHAMQNLMLSSTELERTWSVEIGEGSTDELPLTAQPILVDGEIFTMDTLNRLSAFDIQTGRTVWSIDVGTENEDEPVIGGGISYSAGVLYVTNGYKQIMAVQPATGKIIWKKPLPAPSRAAPTIMDGRLFALTLDNRLLALSAADGSQLWEYQGVSEAAGLVGAASPAASRDIVVPAFSSGDVVALRVHNGSVAWSDNLSAVRRFGGLAALADIKAPPVIDRGIVFAISFGGRLVAIDERTGTRIWQREIGSTSSPWLAGNHVFVMSSDNQLVALARDTGIIKWVTRIENKSEGAIYFTGPVLAGGRLFVAGSDGTIIEASPETGKVERQWNAGGPVTISPIVAGGTLYILTDDGVLSAYK